VLAGLKGLRGLYRSREVGAAVSRQLLDSDASLQQSALKCLKACALRL
jgi:hypothetical protein